ncbi:MAG: heavy-metal-associated domain-containing protein [Alistipes sp.]|jgi:copper chaperone CopZ|nr:cation transporter [Alistipes sp.]MEE0916538.1 heavy-metal-associated domain-containing protein [Alistipes sp.]
MKKIIILALALLTVAGASAQKASKPAKQIVTTVFVTDIDCENCAKKIYDNFYGKGVKSIKCDVATKTVSVTYDASKNSPEGLKPSFGDLKVKVFKHMTAEEYAHYKEHHNHSHNSHDHSHHGHNH